MVTARGLNVKTVLLIFVCYRLITCMARIAPPYKRAYSQLYEPLPIDETKTCISSALANW